MTSKEYSEHAINFFRKNSRYYNHKFLIAFEKDTLEYVKSQSDFKYKDHVEAGVLSTCLVDLGYIKFVKRENDCRYFELTEAGSEFVKSLIESKTEI